MRIGHGYDVHRLVENRKLILCGLDIPYSKGLLGHSDADVAVHALCDALLGALAMRDIGFHFPDNDEKYKDISSIILLRKIADILKEKGYLLCNADITIIAQAPKLSSFIPDMIIKISETMETETENINIKATTEEGLGITGTGSAIACHAVVLINKTKAGTDND